MSAFKKIIYAFAFGYGAHLVLREDKKEAKSQKGMTFLNPVPNGIVTSVWGDDRAYLNATHYGIDLRAPKGSPVYAAFPGEVIRVDSDNDDTRGRHVIVQSSMPGTTARFQTRYLHLDEVKTEKNKLVKAGELIGTVGDTYGPGGGTASPHLHYDMGGNALVIEWYKKNFGTPKGGFPPKRDFGIQFPSEPFIPAEYSALARARAISRGIPILKS